MPTCKYSFANTCNGEIYSQSELCRYHYNKIRKGIDPLKARRKTHWSQYVEIQEDGCWKWVGKVSPTGGYGVYRDRCAHRVVYEIETGIELPEKTELDHLCLFKLCVNPAHLEPVTREENLRRRWVIRKICRNGHDLTLPDAYRKNDTFECYRCYKDTADRNNARAKVRREAAKALEVH